MNTELFFRYFLMSKTTASNGCPCVTMCCGYTVNPQAHKKTWGDTNHTHLIIKKAKGVYLNQGICNLSTASLYVAVSYRLFTATTCYCFNISTIFNSVLRQRSPEEPTQRTMGQVNPTRKLEFLMVFFSILPCVVLFCIGHFYRQAPRKHYGVEKTSKATSDLGEEICLLGWELPNKSHQPGC